MWVHDKNETLLAPGNFTLVSVRADGAYLRLEYGQKLEGCVRCVVIYLNDMGREVLRTTDEIFMSLVPTVTPPPVVHPWFKFKNGFLIVLQGVQEMMTCLSK